MKKFLCVGDNAMPGNELQECLNDARFYESLADSLGIKADFLADKNSTKANVWGWMMEAQAQAIKDGLTYIGFADSNHGTHQIVNGVLESAICCYDMRVEGNNWWPGGLITATEFQAWANGFPQTCRVEVFLDICFSQGLTKAVHKEGFDSKPKSIHNPGNTAGQFRMADVPIHGKLNPNVVVWSASGPDEESADAPWLFNGAFTWAFKKAWLEDRKASRLEVLIKTKARVAAQGFKQTPHLNAYNVNVQRAVGF